MNIQTIPETAQHIAVLLPSLAGGGAERSMLHLVRAFLEKGRTVDLVLFKEEGAYLNEVPAACRVFVLKAGAELAGRLATVRTDPRGFATLLLPVLLPFKPDANIRYIESLAKYLEESRPDVLLSALTYTNLAAIWAKRLAGVSTPVVVSERIALSTHISSKTRCRAWRWRYLLPMVGRTYPGANGIVAVSDSVATDLAENARIDRDSIRTIYNPVVDAKLEQLASETLDDPWFSPGQPPVILGAGRLIRQKDFETLLRAFAVLRAKRHVRLIILGSGKLRTALEALAEQLDIATDVRLPGFAKNPYKYMANAAVFALTSRYEGLPGVLIQALACGCPVVSTDSPGGSAEILGGGRYGRMAPVGDIDQLAAALDATLTDPPNRDELRKRAGEFSVDKGATKYLDYLDDRVSHAARSG